jgi:hypothetical protein
VIKGTGIVLHVFLNVDLENNLLLPLNRRDHYHRPLPVLQVDVLLAALSALLMLLVNVQNVLKITIW